MNVTTEVVTERRYHVILSENEAKILRLADTLMQDAQLSGVDAQVTRKTLMELDSYLEQAGCPYDWYAEEESPF